MIDQLKRITKNHLTNVPGWRTKRKIIVFESDDWGSIRMASKEVFDKLLAKDIRVDQSIYDSVDILEQREDLESLFGVLSSFEDKNSNHPIFTFNTVTANPAFDRIKENHFKEYHFDDIITSYKRYNGENIIDLWYRAINERLIYPQFHAREHLNVSLWMKALQQGHYETIQAFNHNFFGLKTNTPSAQQNHYLAAYWVENRDDLREKSKILEHGLQMFEDLFGFTSDSFVACNYIYPVELEKLLSKLGVKYIQTQRGHLSPNINNGKTQIRRHFTGQENNSNQLYLVRNCTFEPTLNYQINWVDKCLAEIKTAFMWNKPAIISSHRINYVGGMDATNRNNNLLKLDKLLDKIQKKWPNAEFLSSVELGKLIQKDYEISYS